MKARHTPVKNATTTYLSSCWTILLVSFYLVALPGMQIADNERCGTINYRNYMVQILLVCPCPSLSLCPVCLCLPPAACPGVSQCTSGEESFRGESQGTGIRAPWSPSGRSISSTKHQNPFQLDYGLKNNQQDQHKCVHEHWHTFEDADSIILPSTHDKKKVALEQACHTRRGQYVLLLNNNKQLWNKCMTSFCS